MLFGLHLLNTQKMEKGANGTRLKNVSQAYDVSVEDVKPRVLKTESDRKAFVKKYFNDDITNPLNYDLIINTGILSIDDAANAVKGALSELSRA